MFKRSLSASVTPCDKIQPIRTIWKHKTMKHSNLDVLTSTETGRAVKHGQSSGPRRTATRGAAPAREPGHCARQQRSERGRRRHGPGCLPFPGTGQLASETPQFAKAAKTRHVTQTCFVLTPSFISSSLLRGGAWCAVYTQLRYVHINALDYQVIWT